MKENVEGPVLKNLIRSIALQHDDEIGSLFDAVWETAYRRELPSLGSSATPRPQGRLGMTDRQIDAGATFCRRLIKIAEKFEDWFLEQKPTMRPDSMKDLEPVLEKRIYAACAGSFREKETLAIVASFKWAMRLLAAKGESTNDLKRTLNFRDPRATLAVVFNLTEAEVRVVRQICITPIHKEAASELNRTVNTLHQHLNSISEKMQLPAGSRALAIKKKVMHTLQSPTLYREFLRASEST